MEHREIKIPEGMLKAAAEAATSPHYWSANPLGNDRQCVACCAIDCSSAGEAPCLGLPSWRMNKILEAALRWQKEHYLTPTDEQVAQMKTEIRFRNGLYFDISRLCGAWIHRMYDAPEPEFSSEIADLQWHGPISGGGNPEGFYQRHNREIEEALRRGKKAKP